MLQKTGVVLVLVLLASLVTSTVLAAWGGEFDSDQHPMVGALLFDFDEDGQITMGDLDCSGSYAGPSNDGDHEVFLTAAHCLAFTPSIGSPPAFVSFDNDLSDGVSGLIQAEAYIWDPEFGHDSGDAHDLGVVLLPAGSVNGIQPVELPPADYMDGLREGGALRDLEVDAVGYGVIPQWKQAGGPQFSFTGLRNTAKINVKGLTKSNVLYNMNADATGDGGVCYGDSGSPQILTGSRTIISVTSGGDRYCRANNYNYRVDTPQARQFLGQFLELP